MNKSSIHKYSKTKMGVSFSEETGFHIQHTVLDCFIPCQDSQRIQTLLVLIENMLQKFCLC